MTEAIRNVGCEGRPEIHARRRKLQGSWVLVRMRHDRERDRSNRNNWLLIKHRDGHEREGGDPVTDQDRSVASDRTMEESQPVRAARQNLSCWLARPRLPTRCGIRTEMGSRTRHLS